MSTGPAGVTCAICARDIPTDGPAIGFLASGEPTWIPFVEDLRTRFSGLAHPACFAARDGVDELIALVTKNDEKERRGFWALIDQIDRLKKQAGGPQE